MAKCSKDCHLDGVMPMRLGSPGNFRGRLMRIGGFVELTGVADELDGGGD